MLISGLLLAFQTAAGSIVAGSGAPSFTIPRAEAEPAVDGVLSESEWSTAARLSGFWQYEPSDGVPAAQATEVRVFYTSKALHFGIIAHVRPGANINATLSKRDNILNDDRVIIYLDTFNDRRRAFVFGVNPLGVQLDGVRSEGSGTAGRMFGGGEDWSPDFFYESKGQVGDSGYVVEVRIPFKSLRFPSSGVQSWGINISRITPSSNTEDTWVNTSRAAASFLGQAAVMSGIQNVERGVVTEWQPFFTTVLNGERDDVTGRFERESLRGDGGVNFRLGFPAVSLDATINPDFSQVESDVGQVTANERFALFIPEKRPFFLEGIELFSTPNQLVYTRTVVSPVAGAKLTGKLGRLGVAHLTALDERPGDDALFNISRLRTDFGGNSLAGLTLTDRRAGGSTNTVLAADTRIVFAKLYYVDAQFGQSWTREGGVTRSAPTYSAVFDRTGDIWGFHYQLNAFGEDFRTDAGFVPRSDNVSFRAFNRLSYYARTGNSPVKAARLFGGATRLWSYGDFLDRAAAEGEESLRLTADLSGGWRAEVGAARSFFAMEPERFEGVTAPGPGGVLVPYVPVSKIAGLWSHELDLSTPVLRFFNASLGYRSGGVAIFDEGAEGRLQRYDVSLGLRPNAGIRVEAQAALSRITRAFDGSEYARTVLPRLKLEFQPTRSLFFRVVSEYRDDRTAALRAANRTATLYIDGEASVPQRDKRLRTDWLVSYEPSPGTVAFLGYGNTMARPEDDDSLRRTADGFFMKVAYQFRR